MADFDPETAPTAPAIPLPRTLPIEAERRGNKLSRNTKHPVALIVDLLLTLFPIIYGVITLFVRVSPAVPYISYGVAIAANFYNTQNFAGRYLGKLRWATYAVGGKSYYYFESMSREGQGKVDVIVFWACLWFTPVYYAFATFGYVALLIMNPGNVFNIPITAVGAAAGTVNLIAYIRCSNDAKKKL